MVQSRVQVLYVPVKIGLLASATISKLNTNREKLVVSRIGEVKDILVISIILSVTTR